MQLARSAFLSIGVGYILWNTNTTLSVIPIEGDDRYIVTPAINIRLSNKW
jgi:hypothetical protein